MYKAIHNEFYKELPPQDFLLSLKIAIGKYQQAGKYNKYEILRIFFINKNV